VREDGRFKGRAGQAYESIGGSCHALWFPELECEISFWGSFNFLKPATAAAEELGVRRYIDANC
jgi:hypothetical protein